MKMILLPRSRWTRLEIHCRNTRPQRRAVAVPCIAIQVLPIDGTRKNPLAVRRCSRLCAKTKHKQTTMQNIPFSDTFGSRDVEKCTSLWRKAHFEVKKCRIPSSEPVAFRRVYGTLRLARLLMSNTPRSSYCRRSAKDVPEFLCTGTDLQSPLNV